MNNEYDDNISTLRAEILLGNEANAFFTTDIGRYVKARACEVVLECVDKLKAVNPKKINEVASIQLELKAADNALIWLQETIRNGESAIQQLEIMADEEEH